MTSLTQRKLIDFLQGDLAVSDDAIALGLRHAESSPNLLPMILWQYGFVTVEQLDQIFAWLETV